MAVFAHTTRRAVLRAIPSTIFVASTVGSAAAVVPSLVDDAIARHRAARRACDAISECSAFDQNALDAASALEFDAWRSLLAARSSSRADDRVRAAYLLERIAGGGELNSDDVGVLLRALAG